jgi:hypothetical protein
VQFAYNFERVWYLCSGRDWELVAEMMNGVENSGKTKIPEALLTQVDNLSF